MEEQKKSPESEGSKVYDTDDIIFEGKPKSERHDAEAVKTTPHLAAKPRVARRDIKDSENEKTRVDMPTITEEIITPKSDFKSPYEEAPLLEEEEPMTKSYFEIIGKGVFYLVFVLAASIIIAY